MLFLSSGPGWAVSECVEKEARWGGQMGASKDNTQRPPCHPASTPSEGQSFTTGH